MNNEVQLLRKRRIQQLENDIQKGKEYYDSVEPFFIAAGNALKEMRDEKLFKDEGYATFEEYTEKRWGYTKRHANRFIEASVVVLELGPIGPKITNEATAREVGKVPPENREAVVNEALQATDGKITAAAVKEAAKKFPPIPKQRPVVLDGVGSPIPEKAMDVWKRRNEIKEILSNISKVRCAIKEAQESNNIMFAEVSYSSVLAEADALYRQIKTALPHVVCPTCQGKLADNCRLCMGRGMISEFRWDTVVAREIKETIQRRNQKAAA